MKKYFLCIILLIICTCKAGAQSPQMVSKTVDMPRLPHTCDTSSVSLMGAEDEFVQMLTDAWDNLEEEIYIYHLNLPSDVVAMLYKQTVLDNPQYFYVDGRHTQRYYDGSHILNIRIYYTTTDATTIATTNTAIVKATDEILMLIDDNMSDFEKIMTVHDYMALNYEYDTSYQIYDITIMAGKTGVCQAYSYAFKHLMNKLDIPCNYVASDEMDHAWNLVMIDGEWYHIDVTWDDPLYDRYGQVRHTYALLSEQCIKSLEEPHHGFGTGDFEATSTLYDNAPWHGGVGSVVYCAGNTYYWNEDSLVCSNGKTIISDIAMNYNGKKYWNTDGYSYIEGVFGGLASHNGIIYYNTDKGIFSYNPDSGETKNLLSQSAICGLFVGNNKLCYTVYDSNVESLFKKGGEIPLDEFSAGLIRREDGKVVARVCNTSGKPVYIIAFCNGKAYGKDCSEYGVNKAEFDTQGKTHVFVWNEKLVPMAEAKTID